MPQSEVMWIPVLPIRLSVWIYNANLMSACSEKKNVTDTLTPPLSSPLLMHDSWPREERLAPEEPWRDGGLPILRVTQLLSELPASSAPTFILGVIPHGCARVEKKEQGGEEGKGRIDPQEPRWCHFQAALRPRCIPDGGVESVSAAPRLRREGGSREVRRERRRGRRRREGGSTVRKVLSISSGIQRLMERSCQIQHKSSTYQLLF